MRKRNNRRPQQRTAPAVERNYRDANVNFPSTLADNVSRVRVADGSLFTPKQAGAILRLINKQNRFRQVTA